MSRMLDLIQFYFSLGLKHWEILVSLSGVDGIVISLSTLRRHLRNLRLFRRKAHSDLLDIAVFVHDQLDQYGGPTLPVLTMYLVDLNAAASIEVKRRGESCRKNRKIKINTFLFTR